MSKAVVPLSLRREWAMTEPVCVPAWLLAMLSVGAIGTEAIHQLRLRARDKRQNQS
jgi:hypothetical protein